MAARLKVTQVRSANSASRKQRDSLRTLGLGRIGKTTERPDDPAVRGLIRSVSHLVVQANDPRGNRGDHDG
jgi:large subunit ribosomal protein L30